MIKMNHKKKKELIRAGLTKEEVIEKLNTQGILFGFRYGDTLIVCANGDIYKKRKKTGRYHINSKHINESIRYQTIAVSYEGKAKKYLVHRIVAETFLENKDNLPVVNHIDGNTANNSIENLEWCTQAENNTHKVKMHEQKYLTYLKKIRRDKGITTNEIAKKIGMKLGCYRDVENAVRLPTESEIVKIQNYFGKNIEFLMQEVRDEII